MSTVVVELVGGPYRRQRLEVDARDAGRVIQVFQHRGKLVIHGTREVVTDDALMTAARGRWFTYYSWPSVERDEPAPGDADQPRLRYGATPWPPAGASN